MYRFPERKQKKLIESYKKVLSSLENSSSLSSQQKQSLMLKKRKLEEQLFPIFLNLAEVIINTRVLRNSKKVVGGSSIIEGYQEIFEDLTIHQVQQMFNYISKIDTSRKIFSILQKIQYISSQKHFHKFFRKNYMIISDDLDEDTGDLSPIDRMYFLNNPTEYFRSETTDKILDEVLGIDQDEEKEEDPPLFDVEVFEKMEKIIKFQFIRNSKGMLNKLHVINTYLYDMFVTYNEKLYLLRDTIVSNRKYNVKHNTFNGLKKQIRLILNDYVQSDPNIQIGDIQITYYVQLLLYIMISLGKLEVEMFTEEEIEKIKSQVKLFNLDVVRNYSIFEVQEETRKDFDSIFKNVISNDNNISLGEVMA